MDLRWERQKTEMGANGRGTRLVAVLVEDCQQGARSGTPFREQLAAISERYLNTKARDMRAFHHGLFWVRVERKLNCLTLKPQERQKIESAISETVPRPDKDWALWSVTCIPRYDP
jgi:hypothetical protein